MEQFYFEDRAKYIKGLDKEMDSDYVVSRDLGNGKTTRYIPIGIQEPTADFYFQYWHVIEENYSLLANEILCTVKIEYMPSYPGAHEHYCTGSAAKPVQMKKGSTVKDFPIKKITNALQYNVPGVRSDAIGNALETLGNIFGRGLNRVFDDKTTLPSDFTFRVHEEEEESNEKGNDSAAE